MQCHVRFEVQQRLDLKLGGERILGRVGYFQDKLAAIITLHAEVLIPLPEQRFEVHDEAVVILHDLQDLLFIEPGRFGFKYRKRVCPGHSLPSGTAKGRSMVRRNPGIKAGKIPNCPFRNGRNSSIRIQSGLLALGAAN